MSRFDKILLLITVFLVGAAVLVIEILGTRVISPFYGATIFVWASLIFVTLGALAGGYLIGGKIADRWADPRILYFIVLCAGVGIILPVKLHRWALPLTDQLGLQFGPLAASAILFFTPLLLLGTVTPYAIRLLVDKREHSGTTAGTVFALATVGSMVGALLSGFVLLPIFSLQATFSIFGIAIMIVAAIGFVRYKTHRRLRADTLLVVLAAIAACLFWTGAKGDSKDVFALVHQQQSVFGDIKVIDFSRYRCLYVNGSGQTCIDEQGNTDGFFQRLLQKEVPSLALSGDSRVLLLGLGGGGILSLLPEDTSVDIVELDPRIVATTTQYFGFTEDSHHQLITDDARHFLATAPSGAYDLVIENVALGNAVPSYMLSHESFEDMRRVLKSDGILLAHLGTHEIEGDNKFNQAIFSTASDVFPHAVPISSQVNETANLVIFAPKKSVEYQFEGERVLADLSYDKTLVITDDRNPLDYYYISNAISQRENTIKLGSDIFYVE